MKKHKKKILLVFFLSLTVLSGLFISFRSENSRPLSPHEIAVYRGESLYKELFFAEGRVAQVIPEITEVHSMKKTLNAVETHKQELFKSLLIRRISAKHPGFFTAFKSNIVSGNRILIKNTLHDAENITKEVNSEIIKEKLNSPNMLFGAGVAIVISEEPYYFALIDVTQPILVSNIVYGARNTSNTLQEDNLVNSIAINLKGK